MRYCLHCGAPLNGRNSNFCRGHHRAYRHDLLVEYDTHIDGSPERMTAARRLRNIPGWWDYDNNCPTRPARNSSAGSVRMGYRRSTHVDTVPTISPLEYHFRKFGIELETVSASESVFTNAVNLVRATGVDMQDMSYNHTRVPYWKIVTDASLSGGYCREIVSPPMANESDINSVISVVNLLTTMGVKVNNSCGFHVHLDASDLNPKQFARICKFYQVYESDIDKLHQLSRRGNAHYTGSLREYNLDPDTITSMDQLRRVFCNNRYLKVNCEAYLRHGTVEFRQHGATVDAVKIFYWVKFCTRVVEYAKSDRPIDARIDLYTALNLSEAEKLYWNHRKEVLAA